MWWLISFGKSCPCYSLDPSFGAMVIPSFTSLVLFAFRFDLLVGYGWLGGGLVVDLVGQCEEWWKVVGNWFKVKQSKRTPVGS